MLSNVGDCVQYKESVQSSLEELISGSKEVQDQAEKILDTENLFEAQQLLLHHQVECLFTSVHVYKVENQNQREEPERGIVYPLTHWVRTKKGVGGLCGKEPSWMVQKNLSLLLSLLSVKYFRRSYKINFWLELFDIKEFKKYCGEKVDLIMKTG